MTAGIAEAHAAGVVTSASLLVGLAGWDDALRVARAAPGLDIGLHLNLLVGAPLVRAPSLTDAAGRFVSLAGLVARALAGRLDADEVRAECDAQLDAIAAAGIRCTHVDSHRHTHALPVARRAAARDLPLRRPVERHRGTPGGPGSHLHRALVAASWRVAGVGAPRPRGADHLLGISLQGREDFEAQFLRLVGTLEPGTTEFVVHPGRVDAALEAVDGYTRPRERELAALTSPRVRERLRLGDFRLATFADL